MANAFRTFSSFAAACSTRFAVSFAPEFLEGFRAVCDSLAGGCGAFGGSRYSRAAAVVMAVCAACEETCTGATHWLCRRFQRSAFMELLCAGGAHTGSGAGLRWQFEVSGQGFHHLRMRVRNDGSVGHGLAGLVLLGTFLHPNDEERCSHREEGDPREVSHNHHGQSQYEKDDAEREECRAPGFIGSVIRL